VGGAPFANGRPAESPRGVFQNGTPWVESVATRDAVIDKRHPRCQVCAHPERHRIECVKVAGRGLDDVAKEFNIHRDALWRHMQRHVSVETKISYLAGPAKLSELANLAALESKSLLEYLGIVRSIVFGQLDRSAQRDKPYEVERLSGRAVEVLQAIGRITGELSSFTSQNINITNNSVAILNSAPFMDLQAGLLQICGRHPGARSDIVALFRQLDEKHAAPAARMIEGKALADA
jgi:hypothetical protein